jgi:hypothetical protein
MTMTTQADLFTAPAEEAPKADEKFVDFINLAACRKAGLDHMKWRWAQVEVIKGTEFTMAYMFEPAAVGVFKSGPRKGEPKCPSLKACKAVVFEHRAAIDAERLRYEAETGECADCLGTGVWFKRPCPRCNATGKPVPK